MMKEYLSLFPDLATLRRHALLDFHLKFQTSLKVLLLLVIFVRIESPSSVSSQRLND